MRGRYQRKFKDCFLYTGVTLAVFRDFGNKPYRKDTFTTYDRGCFKTSTYVFLNIVGMLLYLILCI